MSDKDISVIPQGFITGIPGGILNECIIFYSGQQVWIAGHLLVSKCLPEWQPYDEV